MRTPYRIALSSLVAILVLLISLARLHGCMPAS